MMTPAAISIHRQTTTTTYFHGGGQSLDQGFDACGVNAGASPFDAGDCYMGPRACRPSAPPAPPADARRPAGPSGAEQQLLKMVMGLLEKLASLLQGGAKGPGAGATQVKNESVCIKVGGAAKPDKYPIVPEVTGAPNDWKGVHGIVASRVTGSEANRRSIHMGGQSPWTNADGKMGERAAVWWAMQKNPDVKYDADKKVFYTTRGGQPDKIVASLDEVMKQIPGAASPNNGAGWHAVGNFINARVAASRA